MHASVAYTTLNLGLVQPGATIDGSAPLAVDGVNVAGSYLLPGAAADHAFVYNIATGLITAPAPPGSSASSCRALAGGVAVGSATSADSGASFGFVYNIGETSFACLQPPGSSSSEATAISGGLVAGSDESGGSSGSFIYNIGGHVYSTIFPPEGFSNLQIAGISNTHPAGSCRDRSGTIHGFIDNAGTFLTLDPAGSAGTHVTAVFAGLVAGSYVDSANVSHGFLYNSAVGAYARIDPPGSKGTACTALYGSMVAGTYVDSAGKQHGFLFNHGSGLYTMITPPGATDSACTGISGSYVVGTFTDSTGHTQAYVANLTGTSPVGTTVARVTLSGLQLTYNGSPQGAIVTTNPNGLPFTVAYNSATYPASSTPPTNPGSYTVVATVNQPSFVGHASGTLVINKALATVVLSNLNATYDGTGHGATVTTTPPGLSVRVSYDGESALPVNAGSHAVQATVTDPNFQGTTISTLTIARATAVVTLMPSSLRAVYNHTAMAATATTVPPDLPLGFTYTVDNRAATPINAGSYVVTATVLSPNASGSASGTLVISPATATVTLGHLSAAFTGQPITVTATTNPPNLLVGFRYDGVPDKPPVAVGGHTVVGTVANPNYTGSGTATLAITTPVSFATNAATPLLDASGARVALAVNPGGVTTTAYILYSTDPAFATYRQTPNLYLGNGHSPVMASAFLEGLRPSTVYYYEVVTVSAAGTYASSVQSFTTLGFDTTLVAATDTPAPGTPFTFANLGNAAIEAHDGVAFQAKLNGPGANSANSAGIWANQGTATSALVAQTGAAAPGAAGATFAALGDPVCNNHEDVAFGGILRLATGLATPATMNGVWATSGGTLGLIARAGSLAPGTGGATFAAFGAVGLSDNGGAIVSATLTDSRILGVTMANNAGVWEGPTGAALTLMLRTGELTDSGKTIAAFTFLPAETCVNGQTRGFGPVTGHLVANTTFTDRSSGIVKVVAPASPLAVATSGDSACGTAGAIFANFSSASINNSDHVAFAASLRTGAGDATGANAGGIWADDANGARRLIARLGQIAPGTGTNGTFTAFSDPVDNDNDAVAFRATLSIGAGLATAASSTGIWSTDSGALMLVAQQGDAAPGCPVGVTFASFPELALNGAGGVANRGGVIFLAKLAGVSVTAANNLGIFAVDRTGTLRLIVRTGDVLNGKTIASLTFLPAETLVNGQARSFAPSTGDLVYNATFSDRSQAIFNVVFP